MWKEALTAAWLLPMSIMDTKAKRVPVWMLWIGAVAALGVLLYEGISGELNGWQAYRALMPGVILLAVAAVTKKAGLADGIILMLLGISMGYEGCVAVSLGSLVMIALFSGILLALHRVKKDTRIPFVPFLAAGWFIFVCGRWGAQ